MIPAIGGRIASIAFTAAVASGAGFWSGWNWQGSRWEARYNREIVDRIQAGETSNAKIITAYREELDRIRNRPQRRLLICPDVPATAGGTPDPATSGVQAGAGQDIGPILAECRQYVAQLEALINAVQTR